MKNRQGIVFCCCVYAWLHWEKTGEMLKCRRCPLKDCCDEDREEGWIK